MTAMSLTRRIANVCSFYSRYLAEKPRQHLRSSALANLIKFKLIEHSERSIHLTSLGATDAQNSNPLDPGQHGRGAAVPQPFIVDIIGHIADRPPMSPSTVTRLHRLPSQRP